MKKLFTFLFALTLSASIFAASKNYQFDQLKTNMEKNGYKLEYAKENEGFNFKKGNAHVEVIEFKDYAATNTAIAQAINVLEGKGFKLVPAECDFGNGLLVFSNPSVSNYGLVIAVNYSKNIMMNTAGTAKELEFSFKTLQNAFKK